MVRGGWGGGGWGWEGGKGVGVGYKVIYEKVDFLSRLIQRSLKKAQLESRFWE